jgi:carbonic anhydrase
VVPEHLFDAGLGELFVVRVAGNVVNDDVLASIEFAATRCGTPLLVVLGHSACAAVTAAVEHGDDQTLGPNARALVDRLQPAVERARRDGQGGDGLVAAATRCNAQLFVAQARQQSAILRDLERSGRFLMLAAVYDLADGDIEWLAEAPERAAAPPAQAQPTQSATLTQLPLLALPAPSGETAPAERAAEEPAAAPPPAPDRASGPAGPGDGMQPDAAVATSPEPTPPVATTTPPAAATETHAAAPAPVEDREHVRLPFSPTELLAMVGIAALVLAALLSLRPRV